MNLRTIFRGFLVLKSRSFFLILYLNETDMRLFCTLTILFLFLSCNEKIEIITTSQTVAKHKILKLDIQNENRNFKEGDKVFHLEYSMEDSIMTELEFDGKSWDKISEKSIGKGRRVVVFTNIINSNNIVIITENQSNSEIFSNISLDAGTYMPDNENEVTKVDLKSKLHLIILKTKGRLPDDFSVRLNVRNKAVMDFANLNLKLSEDLSSCEPFRRNDSVFVWKVLPHYPGEAENISISYAGKDSLIYFKDNVFSENSETEIEFEYIPEPETTEEETLPVIPSYSNYKTWTYGITSPVFDEKIAEHSSDDIFPGKWVINHSGNANFYWTEGCGWYDVNKFFPRAYNSVYSDDLLCWAGSASNLLLWWMNLNKDKVNEYMSQHPEYKDFPGMEYTPEKYNPVFGFFRLTFYDRQAWGTGGINWFIKGEKIHIGPFYNERNTFNGFFTDKFKDVQLTYESRRLPKKEHFNAFIKESLEKGRGIGFVVYLKSVKHHAMNIWGFEFDEEGYVKYVYYADNNEFNDNTRSCCYRRRVVYKEDGTYLLTQNDERYPRMITALFSMDNGIEQWNR